MSSGWYQERRAGLRFLESSAMSVFWKVSWCMALHSQACQCHTLIWAHFDNMMSPAYSGQRRCSAHCSC